MLSSQFEGTRATLVDLLTFEAQDAEEHAAPNADVEEVCNYLERAPTRAPNSLALARHQCLRLAGNWFGGTRRESTRQAGKRREMWTRSLMAVSVVLAACSYRSDRTCVAVRGCPVATQLAPCGAADEHDISDVRAALAAAPPGPDGGARRVRVTGALRHGELNCTLLLCRSGECCNGCGAGLALADFETGERVAVDSSSGALWTCGGDDSGVCCGLETDVPVVVEGELVAAGESIDGPIQALKVTTACRRASVPSAPTTLTYQVPARLRVVVVAGHARVSYAAEDTEPVNLTRSVGAFVGARITREDGRVSLGGVRPLAPPDDPNPVDGLHGESGALDHSYIFELFETLVPPGTCGSRRRAAIVCSGRERCASRRPRQSCEHSARAPDVGIADSWRPCASPSRSSQRPSSARAGARPLVAQVGAALRRNSTLPAARPHFVRPPRPPPVHWALASTLRMCPLSAVCAPEEVNVKVQFGLMWLVVSFALACDEPQGDTSEGVADGRAEIEEGLADGGVDGGEETDNGFPDGYEVSPDSGMMCYADFPCFGHLAKCSYDGAELIHRRDVSCSEVCGPGPCSGGACHETTREACDEGSVCVPVPIGFESDGAACHPRGRVCGGPEGIACAAGELCEYAADDGYSGSPCTTMAQKSFGLCQPIGECAPEEPPAPSCGCGLRDGVLTYTDYPDDCARRAAGDTLLWSANCPAP